MNIVTLDRFVVDYCQNDLEKFRAILRRICSGQEAIWKIAADIGLSEAQLSRRANEFTVTFRQIRPEIEAHIVALERLRNPEPPSNVIPFRA